MFGAMGCMWNRCFFGNSELLAFRAAPYKMVLTLYCQMDILFWGQLIKENFLLFLHLSCKYLLKHCFLCVEKARHYSKQHFHSTSTSVVGEDKSDGSIFSYSSEVTKPSNEEGTYRCPLFPTD